MKGTLRLGFYNNRNRSAMRAMPTVSLRKALYDECVRQGVEPTEYANQAVKEKLREEHDAEVDV